MSRVWIVPSRAWADEDLDVSQLLTETGRKDHGSLTSYHWESL